MEWPDDLALFGLEESVILYTDRLMVLMHRQAAVSLEIYKSGHYVTPWHEVCVP